VSGSSGVYVCGTDGRRAALRKQTALNGIDYLEVVDHDAPSDDDRQRFLRVHFVNPPAPAYIDKANVVIAGGERIRAIDVVDRSYDSGVLVVEVRPRGDFSTYTLSLVESTGGTLHGIDPLLASVDFSFKVECASDFDCRADERCPPEAGQAPPIDYLAKDYESFRRVMLDRLALLLPGWRERTAADLAVTLVELLAYVGDQFSYQQDAIATEAYLGTARLRTSVRRHARLVDYLMHDGANARAFVQLHLLPATTATLPKGTKIFTHVDGVPESAVLGQEHYDEAVRRGAVVFETMHALEAIDIDALDFYAWRSHDCCLPRGATRATLAGRPPLQPGDFVLFKEMKGPLSGNPADADPTHRHVVLLLRVTPGTDALAPAQDVTELEWGADDALPFPLCISSTVPDEHGLPHPVDGVSQAFGNVVLADHGVSVDEGLPKVDDPVRFRTPLRFGPLTQSAEADLTSAASALRQPMANVLGAVSLTAAPALDDPKWSVRRDLIGEDAAARCFVAEVDDHGIATLRFGDDEYGEQPSKDTVFTAHYRTGNGSAGNVAAGALRHILNAGLGAVDSAANPLPARGGIDAEPLEHVRQVAPAAFRVQERAVTESDYAEVTQRRDDVDRASATFRWTGSWYTLFDTVDRRGGLDVDDAFRADVRGYLERFRVIGHDVEVDQPRFVSVDVALTICVRAGYFRSDIEAALRDVFTAGTRRDGSRGFFHPDNFTFGQPVILSRIVAAAAAVDGVDAVFVDRFRRQGIPASDSVSTGLLAMHRLEIARLENSLNFPEHGQFALAMRGGA
jgi:hypothetical protein